MIVCGSGSAARIGTSEGRLPIARSILQPGGRSGTLFSAWSACFLRLLISALTCGRCCTRDQAIVETQGIQIFDRLASSAQSLLLGLLEQRGSLVVQLLDALDRCFVGHLI